MSLKQQVPTMPTSPEGTGQFIPKAEPKNSVEVSFGSNFDTYQVAKGKTVGEVLADTKIKSEIGYGNTKDNLMKIVNGVEVNDDHVLQDGDQLELIRPAGEKA